jgi:hypothetical protein
VVYVDGGFVDSQLYVAAAPLVVGVDERLMLDAVDGVRGGRGLRLGVGATFADQWFQALLVRDDDAGSRGALLILGVIMPHTFEVCWEHSGGSERVGVSFGWGF